jgi:hypothetical protein
MRSQSADAEFGFVLLTSGQRARTFVHGSPASGSLLRKSRYCIRTKKELPAIGFAPSTASLSWRVSVMTPELNRMPPCGSVSLTCKVSAPSTRESSTSGMLTVFGWESPAAHVNVSTVVA